MGNGSFGEVRKCLSRAGQVSRAVKIIKKERMTEAELQAFEEEMNILRELDHPNILKLFEVFEDNKKFFLVTEYCKGGELFDEIAQL